MAIHLLYNNSNNSGDSSGVGKHKDKNPSSFLPDITGMKSQQAFTLIELLVVVAIIGLLAATVLANINDARSDANLARAQAEFNSFRQALELYRLDNDMSGYPADVSRGIPSGLEEYLAGDQWPEAPWPGGIYDWDNWSASHLSYPPYEQVVQLSIRFCEYNQPSTCHFPGQEWAKDFKINSAAYFCIEGPCRPHSGEDPVDYPGYCINCGEDN